MVAHDTVNHYNCIETGQVTVTAENSASTYPASVENASGDLTGSSCTSGTSISLSFSVTQANPAALAVTPTLSGISSPTQFYIRCEISSFGDADVTP